MCVAIQISNILVTRESFAEMCTLYSNLEKNGQKRIKGMYMCTCL